MSILLVETSVISRTELHNTKTGIRILSGHVQLTRVVVDNSSRNCLEIADVSTDFLLKASRFSHCGEAAISVTSSGLIDIDNVTINSGSIGVKVEAVQGHLSLRDSHIFAMTSSAVDVYYTDYTGAGNLTVENSAIYDCSSGIQYRSQNYRSNVRVRVYNNSLTSVESDVLTVTLPPHSSYDQSADINERRVDVGRNTFDDVCDISLSTWSNVNMTFHDNTVKNCDCLTSAQCLVTALSQSYSLIDDRVCDVSTNMFRNNTDQCLVRLKSYRDDITFDGTFLYNQLLANDVTDAAVIIESRYFTLSQNRFENPASDFDVKAVTTGKC